MSRRPNGRPTALEERILARLQDGPQHRLILRRLVRATLPGVRYALRNLAERGLVRELLGDKWAITKPGRRVLGAQPALDRLCPACRGTGRVCEG